MRDMYEGLSAVCAVLRELEPCTEAPGLRLAERHLRLLARIAARRLEGLAEGRPGAPGEAGPGCLPLRAPEGVAHVVQ